MAKKKKKYYVVWKGHEPGIYESWEACQEQIEGFPKARYKSFKTLIEAEVAYQADADEFVGRGGKKSIEQLLATGADIDYNGLAVDAACSGNPGKLEYRGVWVVSGRELFREGPFKSGTNNVGEFLALVHALAQFKLDNKPKIPIYTDSKIAMGWIKAKKARTKLRPNKHNKKLFELIARAERWLAKNDYQNPVLKWETREWGEIPADFGRK